MNQPEELNTKPLYEELERLKGCDKSPEFVFFVGELRKKLADIMYVLFQGGATDTDKLRMLASAETLFGVINMVPAMKVTIWQELLDMEKTLDEQRKKNFKQFNRIEI